MSGQLTAQEVKDIQNATGLNWATDESPMAAINRELKAKRAAERKNKIALPDWFNGADTDTFWSDLFGAVEARQETGARGTYRINIFSRQQYVGGGKPPVKVYDRLTLTRAESLVHGAGLYVGDIEVK